MEEANGEKVGIADAPPRIRKALWAGAAFLLVGGIVGLCQTTLMLVGFGSFWYAVQSPAPAAGESLLRLSLYAYFWSVVFAVFVGLSMGASSLMLYRDTERFSWQTPLSRIVHGSSTRTRNWAFGASFVFFLYGGLAMSVALTWSFMAPPWLSEADEQSLPVSLGVWSWLGASVLFLGGAIMFTKFLQALSAVLQTITPLEVPGLVFYACASVLSVPGLVAFFVFGANEVLTPGSVDARLFNLSLLAAVVALLPVPSIGLFVFAWVLRTSRLLRRPRVHA